MFQRCATTLCLLAACAPAAWAQTYPAKPLRLMVPFPPGGGNDIVGRIVAQKLGEALRQNVVVDNRGGAGGTIGTDAVAKAAPDGHTLLVNNVSLAVNATLFPKLPYDTLRDLAPVTLLGRQPNLVVVHPALPARSVRELVALARSRPGQIAYGSGGVGTSSHLATALLELTTGIRLVHVPYKGLGPALTDLIGGQTQLIISTVASALPHVQSGRLRALAVTTAKRFGMTPEVPTMIEAGVPGFEYSTWYGLLVAGGSPRTAIDALARAMNGVLASAEVREKFAAQGLEAESSTPEQFGAYLRAEVEKWGRVVRASGAKPD